MGFNGLRSHGEPGPHRLVPRLVAVVTAAVAVVDNRLLLSVSAQNAIQAPVADMTSG